MHMCCRYEKISWYDGSQALRHNWDICCHSPHYSDRQHSGRTGLFLMYEILILRKLRYSSNTFTETLKYKPFSYKVRESWLTVLITVCSYTGHWPSLNKLKLQCQYNYTEPRFHLQNSRTDFAYNSWRLNSIIILLVLEIKFSVFSSGFSSGWFFSA